MLSYIQHLDLNIAWSVNDSSRVKFIEGSSTLPVVMILLGNRRTVELFFVLIKILLADKDFENKFSNLVRSSSR
jgi:hypothetical protein